jgi:hypothetical protein
VEFPAVTVRLLNPHQVCRLRKKARRPPIAAAMIGALFASIQIPREVAAAPVFQNSELTPVAWSGSRDWNS